MEQAYYIICSHCNEGHELDDVYASQAQYYKEQLVEMTGEDVKEEEDLPNLTDAPTTAYGSEVSTPADLGLPIIAMTAAPKLESASPRFKEEENSFGLAKIDKQKLLTPKSAKGVRGVNRKKADRIGSGTKRTFAELGGDMDESDEEDNRKKGRTS